MSAPKRDRVYVRHPREDQRGILKRWDEVLHEQSTEHSTILADLTGKAKRVVITEHSIVVETPDATITARHCPESKHGWYVGDVERVEHTFAPMGEIP